MRLQESGEMYLETVLILSRQEKAVRSVDVADYMGFSRPSVSRAIGLLKSGGLVLMDAKGFLTLSEEGQRIAESIYERHKMLTEYLIGIGVSPATAAEDACKMEHVISEESFEAICRHVKSRE